VIALQDTPLDLAAVSAAVADPEHGGAVTFSGTTRREADLHAVEAIEYEAYPELALAEMGRIVEEAEARFGARVALAHRTGRVEVGAPSVIVAASAPHRPAAFAACRYAIDELKARVPIWKRTDHADGRTRWLDGRTGAEREVARGGGPA
jgi:molybdopterin synthase catalytic subunit